MSIKLMAAAWDLPIPSTEKMVLLCLCDFADNSGGNCWPSISTLAGRCSTSERTVQRAIRSLEDRDIICTDHRLGTSSNYHINPSHLVGGDTVSGATNTTGRGDTVSPNPSEPPLTRDIARASKSKPFPKPEWAEAQVWSDFLKARQRKKATNSLTAYKLFIGQIYKLADDDWPPSRLLEHAAAKGWAGIYDPKERTNGAGIQGRGGNGADKRSGLSRAIDEGINNLDAELAALGD